MLVDSLSIIVQAGNGGNGAATFRRNAQTAKGGPDGGNGGNGGSIFFQGSHNITDLRQFLYRKKILAENGVSGSSNDKYGKNAEDLTVSVPLGTHITDTAGGITREIVDTKTPMLVARGGMGGRGNVEFKSAINQTPRHAEAGTQGDRKKLHLELKIIAEIGLIGLPNTGKSSLLALITHAKPIIGDYPFTTLEPNIGMLGTHAIADIPGLIEGASEGKGLGIKFLKHIEKTELLIHCIDPTTDDPFKSYGTVRREFASYNQTLLEKPEIILLTKIDLINQDRFKFIKNILKKTGRKIYVSSIYDESSTKVLKKTLLKLIRKDKTTLE